MSGLFQKFIDTLKRFGLEAFGRYYGTYRGQVVKDADKDGQGRVWVRVPAVAGNDTLPNPAYPIAMFAGDNFGGYFPPPKDQGVLVCFEGGDPRFPMYYGSWWTKPDGTTQLPTEFQQDAPKTESPQRRGFKTPGGHFLLFDDTEGNKFVKLVHDAGGYIAIENDGSIIIQTPDGSFINMGVTAGQIVLVDANQNVISMVEAGISVTSKQGNYILMDGGGIAVVAQGDTVVNAANLNVKTGGVVLGDGGVEPVMLGNQWSIFFAQFLIWANTHVHATAFGPSGPAIPPAQPPPPTVYSMNVKSK